MKEILTRGGVAAALLAGSSVAAIATADEVLAWDTTPAAQIVCIPDSSYGREVIRFSLKNREGDRGVTVGITPAGVQTILSQFNVTAKQPNQEFAENGVELDVGSAKDFTGGSYDMYQVWTDRATFGDGHEMTTYHFDGTGPCSKPEQSTTTTTQKPFVPPTVTTSPAGPATPVEVITPAFTG